MASHSARAVGAVMASSGRRYPEGLIFGCAAAVLLILVLATGCGREPRDAAVSMKGWSLTLDQLRVEYDLINGEGSFDAASLETREAFARTLADKEILLDVAKKSEGELRGAFHRKVMIARESDLVQGYLMNRRSGFVIPEELIAEQLPLVSREAVIRYAQLRDPVDSDAVLAELEEGADFVTLARKYGIEPEEYRRLVTSMETDYWMGVTLRVESLPNFPELVVETLLTDHDEGSVLPPIKLPDGGVILVQFGEYRPIEDADSEVFRDQAVKILEHLAYLEDFESWTDSLRIAYQFREYPDAYPVIIDRIAVFRDSIVDAQIQKLEIDYGALLPPIWNFTAEELRQPVYDMLGKTYTVRDFIRSLHSVKLEDWPYLPEFENAVRQLENRLIRSMVIREAEKAGFPETPDYMTAIRRTTEETWLDQYLDTIGGLVELTEEEIDAEIERRARVRSASEPVSISALTYPEALRSRGEEMLERLQAADSLLWLELAVREHESDERIGYLPPTEPTAVAQMSPDDPLLPLHEAVLSLPAGEVSEFLQIGEDSYGIVRVMDREPNLSRLSFDARDAVTRQLHSQLREARIEQVLEEGRSSRGVGVNLELLAP